MRQPGVERGKGRVHLGFEIGYEALCIERQVERLIVWGTLRVEVGGQVLIGIAVAVGANYPDLLAAGLLTQRLEHADFVRLSLSLL
jgi:hypothetical protein